MTINRETIKRFLIVFSILVVAGVIVAYASYASHGIIEGPNIVITSPDTGETAFSSSTVMIRGIATRTQSITLNGRPILIDEAGNFAEVITLSKGYNIETLTGTDKFGHATSASLQLMYSPH